MEQEHLQVLIAEADIEVSYNPTTTVGTSSNVPQQTKSQKDISSAIVDVTEEMHNQAWNGQGYSPDDAGAYGKEVHRRIQNHPKMTSSRWLHDYWIDINTKNVIQIGGDSPAGHDPQQIQQIDAMYVKSGYRPQVGDTIDPNKVQEVYDVKTSRTGRLSSAQRTNIPTITGKDPQVVEYARRWSRAQGWHVDERADFRVRHGKCVGRAIKVISVAGAVGGFATAGTAWIRYEEEADGFSASYYALLRQLQNADPNDYAAVTSIAVQLLGEINLYLAQFSPASEPFDVVMVVSIYGYLAFGGD
jgi:hypothetical protein